jgi:hypothetical protein
MQTEDKADNLTAIFYPIVYEMCEPRRFTFLWAFTAYYRDNFAYLLKKTKLHSLSPRANYIERPPLFGEVSANLCG